MLIPSRFSVMQFKFHLEFLFKDMKSDEQIKYKNSYQSIY